MSKRTERREARRARDGAGWKSHERAPGNFWPRRRGGKRGRRWAQRRAALLRRPPVRWGQTTRGAPWHLFSGRRSRCGNAWGVEDADTLAVPLGRACFACEVLQ